MEEVIRHRLNDSPIARWTVLFIVATAMMMGYFVNDVMSPLEALLEMPKAEGGLGWTSSDYGFFSGSGSFINVFLLMLFFSGLILDKMGIRFTGVLACSLMTLGTLVKYYAVTTDFGTSSVAFFGTQLPTSAAWASFGFAVFGVGYEMTGITVSKAMVRWFTGHELALAMGIQLAMARLGTAAALSISAPVARHFTLSTPLLVALAFLIIGLLAFLVFCVMDRKLDKTGLSDKTGDTNDEFRLSDIAVTLRNPGFWLITIFCVLFYSAVSPFLKFSTKLMVIKYGVDPDIAGFFSSIAPFGTILMTDDPTLRIGIRSFWAWCHPCHHRCADADSRPLRFLTAHAQQCHCHRPDGGSLHRLLSGTSSPLALCSQDHPLEMSGYCLLHDILYPELWTCHHPDVRRSCQ